jgi:NAD(P)-dependent dehydrogenase (short-subunit alcohol dehydrogenase family)
LETFPKDRFDQVVDLNLGAPFRLIQGVLPLLQGSATVGDPARIINIASVDGMEPPAFASYPYAASKAAIIMLTRHLAGSLASRNITVNAISPGLFPSKMTSFLFRNNSEEALGKTIPLGRVGTSEDIVGALIYLLSRAGSWITGVNLPVAGGWATARLEASEG